MKLFLDVKSKIKRNCSVLCGLLMVAVLWLMLWAGYNTDPNFNQIGLNRIFGQDSRYGVLELVHGFRAFLPLIAMVSAIIFLIKKKNAPENFFLTPLGLLSIYAILGAVASVLSKNPWMSLYSAFLYASVIIVLSAILFSSSSLKKISLIVDINWAVAGVIAIGLIIFFLAQPGVISSLTPKILVCGDRPYEGLAGVPFEVNTLGMAGTRPTGLGRYAGVAAIMCFFNLCFRKNKTKLIWLIPFLIFLIILIFARGRTEIIGFLVAVPAALLLARKYRYLLFFGIGLLIFSAGFISFYKSVCSLPVKNIPVATEPVATEPVATEPVATEPVATEPVAQPNPVAFFTKSTNPLTLSGRTTGIWPESWGLFLSSPMLGYGFLADRIFLGWQHAHNSILHALVQTGILGTVPFLLAFILTFIYLCRALMASGPNRHPEDERKYFLMGMVAVFVFFAVRAITEATATFYSSDWLFVAPIVAYIQLLYFNGIKKQS